MGPKLPEGRGITVGLTIGLAGPRLCGGATPACPPPEPPAGRPVVGLICIPPPPEESAPNGSPVFGLIAGRWLIAEFRLLIALFPMLIADDPIPCNTPIIPIEVPNPTVVNWQ